MSSPLPILLLLLLLPHAHAASYVVGDALGWIRPSTPSTYSVWASRHTFRQGDSLVFNFTTGFHDVAQVGKRSYDSCSPNNANLMTIGPATVSLNSTGTNYYICTFSDHCSAGQKVAINVVAATGSPTTPPPATAPTRPPPTTPPPATAPSRPPSTPTPSPPSSSPNPSPTPSPPSSSPAPSPTPSPPSSSPAPSTAQPPSSPAPSEAPSSGPPPGAPPTAPGSSATPGPGSGPGASPSPPADGQASPPRNSGNVAVRGGWVVVVTTILYWLMIY